MSMAIFLGKRRMMAGSMLIAQQLKGGPRKMTYSIGLFVAPSTRTRVSSVVVSPSHSVMNSAFNMAVTSWSPAERSRKRESISSMKICLSAKHSHRARTEKRTIEGWNLRAKEKRPAASLFDSPNHLFVLRVSHLSSKRDLSGSQARQRKIYECRLGLLRQCLCQHGLPTTRMTVQ